MRVEACAGSRALRKLILLDLTAEQNRAVEAPFDDCFAILGAPATGKSIALAERLKRARELYPSAQPLIIDCSHDIDEYAVALLRSHGAPVTLVDDVEAELTFAHACSPLFALQWDEFAKRQLDPEVPGLRNPARFLESAFRLIRRLRDAGLGPELFLARALAGATEFYASPPNFADPALLSATKNIYRDSLETTPEELLRQHRREVDLAKIVARLYERYIELVQASGRMTGRDAAIAAADFLRDDASLAARVRERHGLAFVDDAQELTQAELALLSAIFGEALSGVTLCGDPASAISALRMTNPAATFARARATVELHGENRSPHRALQRLANPRDEAEAIADRVGSWLAQGCAPERIAVILRSVRCVSRYEATLLDRNIPAVVVGDVNIFCDRRALDALALLWNVYDPFRHEWLLRTLTNSALGLSDASLTILCSEPPDPQRPLFTIDEEPAPTARSSRWNAKRDLRLGWNVIRGERDDALSNDAAARVRGFRASRERWLSLMHEEPLETFARTVWREGLARDGEPGSARARAQQVALQRLLDRLNAFAAEHSAVTIADILAYTQQRIESDLETCEWGGANRGFVQILSVEAARGMEFDYVVVADVRPGAFPRWYSPESFIFSPRLGMVPKENAGDARAARTAKFTFYTFRAKAQERYFDRERRALIYALKRARKSVLVTASGSPIRTKTAPELLEELR